jgi:RHS repeat-associated protein
MTILYSEQYLPYWIQFSDGRINNTYRYDGMKTGKMVYDANERLTLNERYYGDLVLSNNVPARILHADGVIELSSTFQPTYYYHLKDYLGNVRAVVSPGSNNTTVVNQTNEYYPFGMAYTKSVSSLLNPVVPNKYKYNGKEEQEMPGKWLDYGARFYDTQLGRWHSLDPMAEKYYSVSPYDYCTNNPIRYIDPTGMEFSEAAWEYVKKLIAEVNTKQEINNAKIAEKQAKLNNSDLSSKQTKKLNSQIKNLQNQNSSLESVRGEAASLAASSQMYDLKTGMPYTDKSGNTFFDKSTSNVVMGISSTAINSLATFSHELKHAFQFETGKLSLDYSGKGGRSLSDITDEIEAYKRGQFFGANSEVEITEKWVRSQSKIYKDLPSGPIDINSLTGKNPENPSETYQQAITRNSKNLISIGRDPLEVIKQ